MISTADPHVQLEEIARDYRRYRNSDGRRWEVFGECSKRGQCTGYHQLEDFPVVTPEVRCECPLTFRELPPAVGGS